MPFLKQSRLASAALLACAGALIAAPLVALQQERPSRQCMQEIRNLCAQDGARDRARMRACVQERFSELSDECAAEIRQRIEQRRQNQGGNRQGAAAQTNLSQANPYQAAPKVDRTVIYGEHQRQQVDVYEPEGAVEPLPILVFIHGGGWSMGSHKLVQSKPAHFTQSGYYFASAGYRLLPDTPVEQQAADLGEALRALRGQAASIGFDPDRIALMGHSAGAHLAALLATDPAYAADAFDAIKGVVLLDGAGYDVAANMAQAGPRGWQIYNAAFGSDPDRQAALSPVSHIGGKDAPQWLALYVKERDASRDQSQMLVSGLANAGAAATATAISSTDHGRMNRELGTAAGAEQTEAVDAFLIAVFG